MEEIRRHLRDHEFRQLFIERLGWDGFGGARLWSVKTKQYELWQTAQKRGVQVFVCPVGRLEIRNRLLLRAIGRAASKYAHEHILIFYNSQDDLQVWQWSAWVDSAYNFRWREHPFHSDMPPSGFVSRLTLLEFSLTEEDHVSLAEVILRASRALDVSSDTRVFFRNSRYAEESDRLARAMREGGVAELRRFVAFHRWFGHWYVKRYRGLGVDQEDLNQISIIGLLRAARHYDPDQAAFTTYAGHWIRSACEQQIPRHLLEITMRPALFWPYRQLQRRLEIAYASAGPAAMRKQLQHSLKSEAGSDLAKHYRSIDRVFGVRSYDDPTTGIWPQVKEIRAATPASPEPGESEQFWRRVCECLDSRQQTIIRLRFGVEGKREHTLKEIGKVIGLTRERVRQIERDALLKLRGALCYLDQGRKPGRHATTRIASRGRRLRGVRAKRRRVVSPAPRRAVRYEASAG